MSYWGLGDYTRQIEDIRNASRPDSNTEIRKKNTEAEDIPSILLPQYGYMWVVSFDGPNMADPNHKDTDGSDLRFYARSTAIPAISQEPIKRKYAGVTYTYAGVDNSPKILRVTFWDNQRLDTYHFFQRWLYMSNDPEAKRSMRPTQYYRDINLELQKADGYTPSAIFTFSGCFPMEISEAELSYETSEVFSFDVQFSFNGRKTDKKVRTL